MYSNVVTAIDKILRSYYVSTESPVEGGANDKISPSNPECIRLKAGLEAEGDRMSSEGRGNIVRVR